MDIFDRLHEEFFDRFFGLDEASRQELARFAREHGAGEEQVRQIQAGGVYAGLTLGCAHAADVGRVVEPALFRQGAESITLRVSRPPFDEAGHLEIRVVAVEHAQHDQPPPAPEQPAEAGPDAGGAGADPRPGPP